MMITCMLLMASYMAYTGIAYIISFIGLVTSILKKRLLPLRLILIVNILIAIPAKALIGIAFAIISLTLTLNKKVKLYFS